MIGSVLRLLDPSEQPPAIPRVPMPSPEAFVRDFVEPRRPAVFPGGARSWPAVTRWTPAWLQETLGEVHVPVARTPRGVMGGRDPKQGIRYEDMDLRRAIDLVHSGADPGYYAVASVEETLPALLGDVILPESVRRAPRFKSRLWISAPGTVSPLHRDFSENLFAQIQGRKRMIVLSPNDDRRVYEYSFLSRLPHFCAVDPEHPDLARFPRYGAARPFVLEVDPGDLVYLPGRWWHQVRSLDASLSINFWWAHGVVRALTTAADLWKRVRRVRL